MALSRNRKLELLSYAALVAGAVPWLFTSDLPSAIVNERHILLGRYTLGWFAALAFLITPGCLLLFWALRMRRTRSHAWIFARVLALGLALGIGIVVVDVAARLLQGNAYTKEPIEGATLQPGQDAESLEVLRRKPNARYQIRYVDEPETARSYPGRPKGHPPVDVVLTTDARGFRNEKALAQADIITLGDSFTEGFFVSDHQSWPARLAEKTGKTVYNLGVAGGDPKMYARTLRAVGLGLKPKTAIVMLYEANDFFGPEAFGGAGAQRVHTGLAGLVRTSPIVHALHRVLIGWLGPINADGPVPGFDRISAWMPLPTPGGNYALKPKRVQPLTMSREAFAASHGWTSTVPFLKDMHAACKEAGVRLVFAWAPAKAYIVMSLAPFVGPEELHAFLRLRRKGPLPSPDELFRSLRSNMDARLQTMKAFCAAEDIPLIVPRLQLAEQIIDGRQAYYTYDEHWTPDGQDIVAQVVADALR